MRLSSTELVKEPVESDHTPLQWLEIGRSEESESAGLECSHVSSLVLVFNGLLKAGVEVHFFFEKLSEPIHESIHAIFAFNPRCSQQAVKQIKRDCQLKLPPTAVNGGDQQADTFGSLSRLEVFTIIIWLACRIDHRCTGVIAH